MHLTAIPHSGLMSHVAEVAPLRLAEGSGGEQNDHPAEHGGLVGLARRADVLLAGASEDRRRKLMSDLSRTLTPRTRFREASVAWEVLQQAPTSRMVVLTGDLDDISAESLTRLLARRHPLLPVLTLDQSPETMDSHAEDHSALRVPASSL